MSGCFGITHGESPVTQGPGPQLRVGFFCFGFELISQAARDVGMHCRPQSVLSQRSVAQGRVTVAVVVFVFEVADDHAGLDRCFPQSGFG